MAKLSWYSEYRMALLWAGVLNIFAALFAGLPKDLGVGLRRLALLSLAFWSTTAIYVAIRRRPSVAEKVIIGLCPLLLLLIVIFSS